MHISEEGLRFIERWEEKVLYVYDDKVPKRKISGVRKYPEWDGSEIVGTLTIGYGHTDAAGWPKIRQGLRITDEQADEILDSDLKPCMAAVNKLMQRMGLDFTQGQFDASTSFTFNCGQGNLNKLFKGLTSANYKTMVPKRLMQYTNSKGEHMNGLVHRRAGEVQLWSSHDDPEDHENMPIPHTADREDHPKSIAASKSANSAVVVGGAGASVVLSNVNDVIETANSTKSGLKELGVFDIIGHIAQTPYFWVGLTLVLLAGFIYWDRHRKLEEEHV